MKKTFMTAAMMAAATWFAPQVNAEGGTKSIPVSFKMPSDPRNSVSPEISALAKKTQVERYRGADGLVWESEENGQSVCSFSLNDIRHRADYYKNGSWRWTEKSYKGAALVQEVKDMLFQDFGKVDVQWVDEITLPDANTNYFVVISTEKLIRRVRVVDDKIDILEEFARN